VSRIATQPDEVMLDGGTTNAGRVFRVGDTVRRPQRPTGDATRALLDHLEQVGFDGAPRYLGVDGRDREVLTYIRGEPALPPYPDWAFSDETLVSVAQLLRRYHDAAASFDPSGYTWPHPLPARFRRGLVTHNDPNLDNVIFENGRAVALIDFDLANPGCAGWDLACAARLWVPLRDPFDAPPGVAERALARLALFADAYGATREQRTDLADALLECHAWCYAIVSAAVARNHPAFGAFWRAGGRSRAIRTRRRLSSYTPEIRAALGLA
jgi:hypothetical protein